MSSPFANVASAVRLVEGEEAMAVKVAAVLKVSSLTKSNPRRPGLVVFPTIRRSMYDVGIPFHASKDPCSAAVAVATVRTGAPSGLGTGSAGAPLTRYFPGSARR